MQALDERRAACGGPFRRSGVQFAAVATIGNDARRLRALIEAGTALSSELSLDALLQRLVEAAAELTDARYAALGVIDRSGTALERFITTGTTPEEQAAIGEWPRGLGVLGVLIKEREAAAASRISPSTSSRSAFRRTILRCARSSASRSCCAASPTETCTSTEKLDGAEFTEEDQELVTLLAAQAAVAIENARLYESATGWLRQMESLNEIGNALLSEIELPRLLALIARRLRELGHARLVTIALPQPGGDLRIEAADGDRAEAMMGAIVSGGTSSKSARVLERRQSERVDSMVDDLEIEPELKRLMGGRAALFVPLLLRERAIGVITVVDKTGPDPRFSDDDLRLAEAFAGRAAAAVDLSGRVARDVLRRVVAGQELERTRLARELHDETGQALTSILLGLRTIQEADDVTQAVDDLRTLVVSTLQSVRRLAVELRPSALDDYGLVPALERLTGTAGEQGGPVGRSRGAAR